VVDALYFSMTTLTIGILVEILRRLAMAFVAVRGQAPPRAQRSPPARP
jgi:hypothetical protein